MMLMIDGTMILTGYDIDSYDGDVVITMVHSFDSLVAMVEVQYFAPGNSKRMLEPARDLDRVNWISGSMFMKHHDHEPSLPPLLTGNLKLYLQIAS
jgi:hypothetical protein